MTLHEISAVFSTEEDETLADLGIKQNEEIYFDKATIDLDRVESFYKSKCNEKEATTIIMYSGEKWTADVLYNDFKKLF